jgi:N-acetylmuramoyl-L-alanine amidase
MHLFKSLLNVPHKANQGSPNIHTDNQPTPEQSLILEPILTPSGLPVDVEIENDTIATDGVELLTFDPADSDIDRSPTPDSIEADRDFQADAPPWSGEDFYGVKYDFLDPEDIGFDSGTFIVGETGEITIDYLFDGGAYQGELAIFSLENMARPGTDEFVAEDFAREAARRANSNSDLGHIAIRDRAEGARFSGELDERNWNQGNYVGAKTFQMRSGDEIGFMLVPNGRIQEVLDNPAIDGAKTPLFSLATANPDGMFHAGQIADVTGDGNTFVFEDLRVDGQSDLDYNDLIFQVRGAEARNVMEIEAITGEPPTWMNSDLGQSLLEYSAAYTDSVEYPAEAFAFGREHQPLVGIIDTGFAANNPDINYDNVIAGSDFVDGDSNPFLNEGKGDEHGTHILGIITAQQNNDIGIDGINDEAPVWLGRAVGSGRWADSLIEFIDAARESGQPNALINLSMDLTQIDTYGNVTTRYEFTPLEMAALEYARQNNVLVTVAAGNEGGVMSALGQASEQFDNIITVGAAERTDSEVSNWKGFDRANYSNYGAGLNLVADGGTLESPILSTVSDSIAAMRGTSVATAQVTGAASQIWAANPDLNYRQVIEILKSTATDLSDVNPDLETGAGLINIAAAVHLAKATQPKAHNPDLQVVPTTWSGEGIVTPMERAVRYSRTMKDGETLWGIANSILGDGNRWVEITKDAAGTIPFTQQEAPNLPIGQVVYIPGNNPNASLDPTQIKQVALNSFLQSFGAQNSNSWLNFLKKMFERTYSMITAPLNNTAAQSATGATSPTTSSSVLAQSAKTLTGKKILLDPGHGVNNNGFDPGAVGNGTTEAIENLHQAKLIAQHLRQLGAEVKVLDAPLSLAQIGQQAAGNDLFVSLHQNAFNKSAQGHEVYSHPNAPAKDAALAQAINSELDAIFLDSVIPNRGTKTADFSVLRNAPISVPAVLVESLFIDAPGMSRANVEKAATAVARGIEKFFTGTATGSLPEPSPKPPTPGSSFPKPGVVNAKVGSLPLNFRGDAYVGATVLNTLSKGTQFEVLNLVTGGSYNPGSGSRNDWYQIKLNGQIGYVAAYYVDVTNNSNQPAGFKAEPFSGWVGPHIGVALRNSPNHADKSGLAESYKRTLHFDGWMYGESVTDIWTGKPDALWYRYWRDGKAYWVPSAYIYGYPQSRPPIQPGGSSNPGIGGKPGYVNSSIGLNFRTGPSAGASKIRTLANGTNLTILEQVAGGAYYPGNRTDWYKVKVGNTVGYVAAYYVREGSSSTGGPDTGSFATKRSQFFSSIVGTKNIKRRDTASYQGQCVSFAARYVQDVYLPASQQSQNVAYGNGKDTARVVSQKFGQYFEPATSTGLPKVGAIISFPDLGNIGGINYGHVAVVTNSRQLSNGQRQVKIMDSNGPQGKIVKQQTYWINVPDGRTNGYGRGIYWTNPRN